MSDVETRQGFEALAIDSSEGEGDTFTPTSTPKIVDTGDDDSTTPYARWEAAEEYTLLPLQYSSEEDEPQAGVLQQDHDYDPCSDYPGMEVLPSREGLTDGVTTDATIQPDNDTSPEECGSVGAFGDSQDRSMSSSRRTTLTDNGTVNHFTGSEYEKTVTEDGNDGGEMTSTSVTRSHIHAPQKSNNHRTPPADKMHVMEKTGHLNKLHKPTVGAWSHPPVIFGTTTRKIYHRRRSFDSTLWASKSSKRCLLSKIPRCNSKKCQV